MNKLMNYLADPIFEVFVHCSANLYVSTGWIAQDYRGAGSTGWQEGMRRISLTMPRTPAIFCGRVNNESRRCR